jgi:hypothetical protein
MTSQILNNNAIYSKSMFGEQFVELFTCCQTNEYYSSLRGTVQSKEGFEVKKWTVNRMTQNMSTI